LKIPEAECGKPCNAGHLREAEGCRPYRLRYNKMNFVNGCRARNKVKRPDQTRDDPVIALRFVPGCH